MGKLLKMDMVIGNDGENSKIWVFWQPSTPLGVVGSSSQYITLGYKERLDYSKFFTFIYASCSRDIRTSLFSDLTSFGSGVTVPWIIGGDFNCICHMAKKIGGQPYNLDAMMDFNAFTTATGLFDAGYIGSPYTWTNNRVGLANIRARLDRVLFNHSWQALYPSVQVTHLNRGPSDHAPLAISSAPSDRGPSRFTFQEMWTTHEEFLTVVNNAWKGVDTNHPNAFVRLQVKLRETKVKLQNWNKNTFGNVTQNVSAAEEEVNRCQSAFDGDPSDLKRADLNAANAKLQQALRGGNFLVSEIKN